MRGDNGETLKPDELPSVHAVRQQQLIRAEHQIIRADQSIRYVSSLAAPLPLHGFGAMLALTDITERKRLEQIIQSRLSAMTSPPGENADLSFTDLFDLKDIQAVQDAFRNLRLQDYKKRQQAAAIQLRTPGLTTEKMLSVQKEILDLQALINDLSAPATSASPALR